MQESCKAKELNAFGLGESLYTNVIFNAAVFQRQDNADLSQVLSSVVKNSHPSSSRHFLLTSHITPMLMLYTVDQHHGISSKLHCALLFILPHFVCIGSQPERHVDFPWKVEEQFNQ